MAEIGPAMGVTWSAVQDRQMSVWLPDEGQVTKHVILTYSAEGPVHLELLQGEPGSIWDADDFPGAHHFGVWSDDPGGDVQRMIDAGWHPRAGCQLARGGLRPPRLRALAERVPGRTGHIGEQAPLRAVVGGRRAPLTTEPLGEIDSERISPNPRRALGVEPMGAVVTR